MTTPFIFNSPPSIRFGDGLLNEIGPILSSDDHNSAFVVTDAGMMATGIVSKLITSLEGAGIRTGLYSDVVADPPERVVHAAVDSARVSKSKVIVGIGGGSSLDVAKLVALLVPGHQALQDAYGVGNAIGPRLPLLLVPTTAGTGSEVTPISIITTGKSEKMGVVSPLILPDIALLDPTLTISVPAHVTAATGIDAMVHAIEAYTSTSVNNNPISRQLALQALGLLGKAVEVAVHDGNNKQARADMMLGSMLAGQAFANSPVAAVHALAYPIGGHYKVPHGLSNALVLPHVLRFNAQVAPEAYAELLPHVFPDLPAMNVADAAMKFAQSMADLSQACGLEQGLREMGIAREVLPKLARDAINQTRLLVNNPRPVDEAAAMQIYEAAW